MASYFDLEEELRSLADEDTYDFPCERNLKEEDGADYLENAIESITSASENISDPEVFGTYRSFLKYSSEVPASVMAKVLDSLISGLQAEHESAARDLRDTESYILHGPTLERYAFLLDWATRAIERAHVDDSEQITATPKPRKGRGGKTAAPKKAKKATGASESVTWTDTIPNLLGTISKLLAQLSSQKMWSTTVEREAFLNCIIRPAYRIAENEQYMKAAEVRLHVYKVLAIAVKHHGHGPTAQTNIIQRLTFHEHLSEPMAELLSLLSVTYDHQQLGEEVVREIANMNFAVGTDTKAPRSFSRFLIKLSELAPRMLLKQMSLLLNQLDSESYPMRIAIIEVMGSLIKVVNGSGDGDNDNDSGNVSQVAGLIEAILDRMLDTSSYVRVKVLAVLNKLWMHDLKATLAKQRLNCTRFAVVALEDKVASVRKSAISLLVVLMQTHPWTKAFNGFLEQDAWENGFLAIKAEVAELEKKLVEAVGEQPAANAEGEDDDEDEDEEDESMEVDADGGDNSMPVDGEEEDVKPAVLKRKKKKKRTPAQPVDGAQMNPEQAVDALNANELAAKRLRKKYFVEAIKFVRELDIATGHIQLLLGSTSKAEVLEAMDYFQTAHALQVTNAEVGIRRMLHLIWTKDNNAVGDDGKELKGIRQKVLEVYKNLYFDPNPSDEPKVQINYIAKQMVELTYNATLADLTSYEEMLRIMVEERLVHRDVINKLWSIYHSTRHLTQGQRRGAIIVLGMMASADRGVLTEHVDTMLKVGLGSLSKHDLTLARHTCVALQRLNGSAKKVKGSLVDKTIRLEIDNKIFQRIKHVIERPTRSKDWFGLAEQGINTIYALARHPDVVCNDIIKTLTVRAFTPRAKTDAPAPAADEDAVMEDEEDKTDQDPASEDTVMQDAPAEQTQGSSTSTSAPSVVGDAFELAQLLFVVGHVAIKHIAYLEVVEREWKRQKDEREAANKKDNAREGSQAPSSKDGDDLDQVTGNAEDDIGDRVQNIRENEMLYGEKSLLALYGGMIVHICQSPNKYKNATLRAAAILSFSKFLCVSSKFCEDHHRLLFVLLDKNKKAPNVRSNIVIALGDIAVSFSNILDENHDILYRGLSDPDPVVKKNTLMVLTHLILNGMIKVKGQLGEMAKCLEDDDARIADLAKMFFHELSTKDNAIYNNLPDLISHLSVGAHAVDEESFQKTLTFIFKFIEKEKQAENITEKLCSRFKNAEEPRQWRDFAFCLSLLPYKSDRSVKKLIEGFPHYQDKLYEPVVFERFNEILVKARTNKSKDKPDIELNEFENMLNQKRAQGEDDQALEKRAAKAGKKKKGAAAGKSRKQPARKKTPAEAEEDMFEDD